MYVYVYNRTYTPNIIIVDTNKTHLIGIIHETRGVQGLAI